MILEIPQVVGPVPAQPCVKSSFMAGWQRCHLELQMLELWTCWGLLKLAVEEG